MLVWIGQSSVFKEGPQNAGLYSIHPLPSQMQVLSCYSPWHLRHRSSSCYSNKYLLSWNWHNYITCSICMSTECQRVWSELVTYGILTSNEWQGVRNILSSVDLSWPTNCVWGNVDFEVFQIWIASVIRILLITFFLEITQHFTCSSYNVECSYLGLTHIFAFFTEIKTWNFSLGLLSFRISVLVCVYM